MPKNLTQLLLSYQSPRGRRLAAVVSLLALLLLGSAALVQLTGGAGQAFLHTAYLPIILAGFLLHRRGGIVTGLVVGFLLSPWLPFGATVVDQNTYNWLIRLVVFVVIGAVTGQFAALIWARAERLEESFTRTLHNFAALVAGRDEQVEGHCERIAANARAVGNALGLAGEELDALYWSGILHDLGKAAIPDRILLKSGPLNDEEFQQIKSHCAIGADLVGGAGDGFEPIATGIRCHHERWDGTGYPAGLQGKNIPLFGRVLGVVDVFEALTSERPYRKPVGVAAGCELLRRESGGHFDPQVVGKFLELLDQGRIEVAGPPQADPPAELPAAERG